MLLNKLHVLDKGFVAKVQTNGEGILLQDLQDEYFKTQTNKKLLSLSSATLVVKCPLFVQLNLSQYGFTIISTPSENIEAYIPDSSSVESNTLEDRQRIIDYIQMTTEALILNQKGLLMDGAGKLTSQILTPISVYNELIVHGSLKQWLEYLKQNDLPKQMESYRLTVEDLLLADWKNLQRLKSLI